MARYDKVYKNSAFYGTPAHTLISVTYHATDKGRAEWGKAL